MIYKPILSGQRLNVLGQLCDFLGFELGKLCLLVDLLLHALALLTKCLDLLLPLKQFPLVGILLASGDAHLVLDVSKLKALLLVKLLDLDQLLRLLIQIPLHLVQVAVQHGHRLLQVIDLLIFGEQLSLVGLDVVEEDGFFVLSASRVSHCLLQPLQQLILRVIQVFNQRAHAFDLSVQILALLLLCAQLFLTLAQIVLQAHLLVLNQGERLLQVNDLNLGFALLVLRLSRLVLTIVDLGIELRYLLPSLLDVFFKCGIIALHGF